MSKGLKQNALSLLDTVTLAVAGSAPSYSLNATTAALIAAVGLASPAALLIGAIPMFGISFAFKYLNQWRPDAGAAYAWVGRSIHPMLGFLAAWTFLVLSTVFMVAAALPVGVATLHLVAPAYEESVAATAMVGGAWFSAVNTFSLSWFSPASFGDWDTFMGGMLVAVFYYFGWDVTSNVAEEAQGKGESGGASGVYGMVGVMVLFLLIQTAVQMGMTPDTVEQNSASLLNALGDAVLPKPWGSIAILAVILSTVGTIETQITQCARLLFSMGRDGVMHKGFSEVHSKFETPWLAGVLIWALSIALLAASSASESVGGVMSSLISAIGVMVSIYYGLTGLACVWYYRKSLTKDGTTLFMRGIWPGLSAIFLLYLGARQVPDLGGEVAGLTVGALALGILPMLYFRLRYKAGFYSDALERHS